jgi:4-hydroxybenzoate polyprenyltransferase
MNLPAGGGPREGQTIAGQSLLVRYANLVRLPHTVFALPFALVGVILASRTAPLTWQTVVLVALAFTAARFTAMAVNRIVDRRIDALNPRTQQRELPSGKLTLGQAWAGVVIASIAFLAFAAMLNTICLILAPFALVWIASYSFAKRFTSLVHFWLGSSLAIAPVAGYLAVTGQWAHPWWVLLAIAGAVMLWVAGFDVFYALQDEDFDREHRLHSLVVTLGTTRSVLLAKIAHGLAIMLLALFGLGAGLGWPYFLAVAISAALIAYEHSLVKPSDLSRLDAAFFTTNGVVSIAIFVGALADRLI